MILSPRSTIETFRVLHRFRTAAGTDIWPDFVMVAWCTPNTVRLNVTRDKRLEKACLYKLLAGTATGASALHGKSIQRPVRRQTYSQRTVECGFS